jgi:thioesterase domain-containing protein
MVEQETAVTQAVRDAWTRTLPGAALDLDLPWRDLGLDSLKAMEFVVRLERLLNKAAPLEALSAESSARDLIQLLSNPSSNRGPVPDDRRVFLIPGLHGDEPYLASLRLALKHDVDIETLSYPDLDWPARALMSMAAMGANCCAAIRASQPAGEIRIMGYSFGALVAQEACRQLEAEDRVVSVLILFDGPLHLDADGPLKSVLEPPFFNLMFRTGVFDAVRLTLKALNAAHRSSRYFRLRRGLIRWLRYRSVKLWHPKPCRAPTLMVTSREFKKHASFEEWRALCPDLTAKAVNAGHLTMFEPDPLGEMLPAIRALLTRVGPSARPPRQEP